MSKQLSLLHNLINNLSTRERVLVLLGILSIIYILWDTFLISPTQTVIKNLVNQRTLIQEQMVSLETRRILANGLLQNSKRKIILGEISTVEKKIKNFDGKILERLQGRVAPHNMASMLNDVLQNNQNLELLSISNMPAVPFVTQTDKDKKEDGNIKMEITDARLIGIFMHSLELQLEGSYLEVLSYLRALESLEWKIFWDQVNLEVIEYPKVKVHIKVHTFSLKDGWLSV